MRTECLESLIDISSDQWNGLVEDHHPFLKHEFLVALERHHCVGPRTGWYPKHSLCRDDHGNLVGATPLYLKDNSYGEFVFDWSWANAYQRYGRNYYPKLVSAIPFTPATGQRLLIAPNSAQQQVADNLIQQALETVNQHNGSSAHWLFTAKADREALQKYGFLTRLGYQFHWHNQGYRDFADFLDALSAKKRKNIKRERRQVHKSNLSLQGIQGDQVSDAQWHHFYTFYCDTFERLGGFPTLTLPFFQEIATTMGQQILLVLAYDGPQPVAGAISFRSDHTLFGRHWGCRAQYDSLHFEACYYQGIEYCIHHNLQHFEPGAQGEHKIYRGFLPTLTHSAHWIPQPDFRAAIADFLQRETPAVEHYVEQLWQHSPYRSEGS